MITVYDYVIIGFYLVFMLAIGLVFRRMSKDTSDYFRAGGAMPWWLTGASAWIFSFSAWTFTGAAGKVYETGTLVLPVFYSTAVALCFVLAFTCLRFRRMRVITWMEGVRLRYGPFSEQFYTWIKLPLLLLFSGASLNAIGVFMSAVFDVPMNTMLVILGAVVTVVAFGGGSWAVLASDFVQAFLIVTITICTAVMTLARPEIGGLGGLLHKVPSAHLHWTELARPELILVWIVATMWLKFSDENNMERATMYLMTRSDKDAKRMVLIPLIGTLIGPLIWFIPSMAASIMHPNLAAEFPGLKQPHEAAFLAVSMDVMPKGLLGLLLSAMLGATVTSMDAGLNKNVGIAIRSLYKPLIRPDASEKHLLVVGKMCTLLFGAIIILLAVFINSIRQTNLFDFLNQLAANLLMPLALPLIFGLFYKRTPGWSAWSTALVAGAASWLLSKYFSPELFQHWLGWTKPLTADEATYLKLAVTTLGGTVLVGSAWYFFTSLFYRKTPEPERERIEMFFSNLQTPVHKEGVSGVQTAVYKLLGSLCLVYGAFILLLMLIPNRFTGRLAFLFCGGVMFAVGAILFTKSKHRAEQPAHVLSATAEVDAAPKNNRVMSKELNPVAIQFRTGQPWRTLLNLYWPERRSVGLALLSYLFKASPVWILPVITANIIDIIAHHREGGLHALWLNATVGAVAIAQNILSAAFYVSLLSRAIRNVEVRLRSALVRRLQMLSISYHNRSSTGALQTKVTRDVESIEMMSRQIVDVGFFALVTILVALGVTAWRMPAFLPAFILFVPMIWLLRHFMGGKMRRHNENLRKEVEGMNSLILGMINMIPITRAHAVEEDEVARLENRFSTVRKAARSFDFVAGTFGATAWVILMLFNLAGLTTAAILSYEGQLPLSAGDIVLLAGYFNTIMAAVMQLNAMLPVLTRGFDGLRSISEVIECPDIEENRGKRVVEKILGNFVFENVGFVYDRNGEAPAALKEINFNVAAGETIGIVGPSGSGKSTLASLITGFHRPTTGRILLDGVDINTIDLRTYRQHLAVVSQQTILFDGTLRENIIYGLRGVAEEDLARAIADANAAEFINALPKRLNTEIGSHGVQLSGGQRQRIAIARALLRDPRVLILDEATSALDVASEAVVQQALERLMTGRTTFIIAHGHAILRRANRILALDKGALVTHADNAQQPVRESQTASANRTSHAKI